MTEPSEIQAALRKPLADEDIEWRVGQCGKKNGKVWALLVPYMTSRAVMNRLDDVVGVERWSDEYREFAGGIACRLTIHWEDGSSTSKEDAAPMTDIEAIKGGFSDALKRTAVKFGIGRHLYDIGEVFAENVHDGYPPREHPHAVRIISRKDDIVAWCPAPSLSADAQPADSGRKPFDAEKTPEPQPRYDSIGMVQSLEARGFTREQAIEAGTQWKESNQIKRATLKDYQSFLALINAGEFDHIRDGAIGDTVTDDDIDKAFTGGGGGMKGVE